ncbi:MAG: glycosyltransferase [Candidatus Dormibacteraceae bacterium]
MTPTSPRWGSSRRTWASGTSPAPTTSSSKAGNLNHALRQTNQEFVIVVDADFALRPEFIERTIPLFHDRASAAVETPQMYSNEGNFAPRDRDTCRPSSIATCNPAATCSTRPPAPAQTSFGS